MECGVMGFENAHAPAAGERTFGGKGKKRIFSFSKAKLMDATCSVSHKDFLSPLSCHLFRAAPIKISTVFSSPFSAASYKQL